MDERRKHLATSVERGTILPVPFCQEPAGRRKEEILVAP